MTWYIAILIFCVLMSSVTQAYFIYQIIAIDARSRGLKHPKLWGLFSLSGQGSGGLFLYLLGRNKYPRELSEEDSRKMEQLKRKTGATLLFLAVSTIALFTSLILTFS